MDKAFDAMDDAALIWACVEPAIKRMRAKAFDIKSEVYGGMTNGQRALLMFQVLRGHSGNGAGEFFGMRYLLDKEEVWRELERAFEYFGCAERAELTGELHQIYNEQKDGGIVQTERVRITGERLKTALPEAEKRVAAYIRSHAEAF